MLRGLIVCVGAVVVVFLIQSLTGCGYVQDAADTTYKETKVSTLLQKYMWFKNAKAELEAKKASIQVQQAGIDQEVSDLKGQARDRTDKEDLRILRQTLNGTKQAYNSLAAEYNAKMAEINWAFCNAGKQPDGSMEPLPRSFAPYIVQ